MKLSLATTAALLALALGGSAYAASAEEIIASNKCTKCHKETTSKKGPSYKDVAAKYAGKADAANKLFAGLKAGGKMGDEDDHKQLKASDDEIKAVVAYVLSRK
jgi:cytochrome c